MSESFRVGEVVQIVNNTGRPGQSGTEGYLGTEGTVCELFVSEWVLGPMHAVRMSDGVQLIAAECCLRKKRPPGMDPTFVKWRNEFILEHALHV
jgi:hypothetical protein